MKTRVLSLSLVLVAGAMAATACSASKKNQTSNADLYGDYSGNKYEKDMVATEYSQEEGEDQAAIAPRTLAAIEDAITTVYITDIERCLEKDMDEMESRSLAGEFSVEMTIETSGKVSDAKVLMSDVQERKPKEGTEGQHAVHFDECLVTTMKEWEFDPAPEAKYTHTHVGIVGEAW